MSCLAILRASGAVFRIRDVDVAPVLNWDEVLGIIYNADDAGLANDGLCALEARNPGYIVDKRLLCLIILAHASGSIRIDISLLHELLIRHLLGSYRGIVLSIVHRIFCRTLIEEQGQPVLRIRIVSTPVQR